MSPRLRPLSVIVFGVVCLLWLSMSPATADDSNLPAAWCYSYGEWLG